jgi:hypothetical protein
VISDLRQHADEAVRDRLAGDVGRGLQHLEHRVHPQALHRVAHELVRAALGAARAHEPAQRGGLQGGNEARRPRPECFGLGPGRRPQRLRDLQQIAGDDLIVGLRAGVCVDGAGQRFWRRVGRIGPRVARPVAGKRGLGEPQPELRAVRAPRARRGVALRARHDREVVEGERMQANVRPRWPRLGRTETDRAALVGFGRQEAQRRAHFTRLDAAQQAHGAELMGVEGFGQPPQHRVGLVRGHTFHDQLTPRDTDRDLFAIDNRRAGAAARRRPRVPARDAPADTSRVCGRRPRVRVRVR